MSAALRIGPPEVVVETIGGNCPVQAEGTVDGWPFYFRARGEHWSLSVAEPGFDGCGEEVWRHDADYGDEDYAAGWMTEDEARGFIAQAAALFAAWRAANPEVDGSGRRTAELLRVALADARKRFGQEVRARYAAERESVRLAQALGLDFGQRYPIAAAQVANGVP